MGIQRQILSFGLLLLISSSLVGEAQCPGNVVPVRYHSLGRSYMATFVTINESGPYKFMVDTGSEITVMEPSLAAELRLEPVGIGDLVAGVRHTATGMVSAQVMAVGSYVADRPLIAVASLAQLQDLHPGIRGILGEDFLKDFDLLIDRGKKILCLHPTTGMRGDIRGERIPIIRQGWEDPRIAQAILVPVQLVGQKARTMYLRLDSGATLPILYVHPSGWEPSIARAKALPAHVVGDKTMFFKMMSAQEIRIGNQVVSDVEFAAPVASRQNVEFAGEDGLLPTSLFKRVFISYRDGFVILNPRLTIR